MRSLLSVVAFSIIFTVGSRAEQTTPFTVEQVLGFPSPFVAKAHASSRPVRHRPEGGDEARSHQGRNPRSHQDHRDGRARTAGQKERHDDLNRDDDEEDRSEDPDRTTDARVSIPDLR